MITLILALPVPLRLLCQWLGFSLTEARQCLFEAPYMHQVQWVNGMQCSASCLACHGVCVCGGGGGCCLTFTGIALAL